jgi:hypothetical protein
MADESTTTINATFATREAAEIAVERLVQEIGIDRTDIFIEAAGGDNTAGSQASGGDAAPSDIEGSALEPATNGEIKVSADVATANVESIQQAFRDAGAADVSTH